MRHISVMRILVVVFAGLFVANRALAQVYNLEAILEPSNEVPPHNTPAYGYADFTLDSSSLLLTVTNGTGTYNDLLAGATQVLIADAPAGSNGPTQFTLTLDTPGQTSGTFEGSGTLTNAAYNDALAGNLYINIRDSVYPSGEIRGQLEIVPEPGSLAILAGVGLLAMRRRRAPA